MDTTQFEQTCARTELTGKAIVITGGSTGIGRATALLLASKGASVVICGRHDVPLVDALDCADNVKSPVYAVNVDLSQKEGVDELFAFADDKLGKLDVFINNAAMEGHDLLKGAFANWEYIVRTNLLAYIACSRAAADRMREKGGHIVNVGSMSAHSRKAGSEVYVGTKSGVQGFTDAFRKNVAEYGIKVTLVEPGAVGTDMQPEPPEVQEALEAQLKMLKAEDIAACIEYCLIQPPRCNLVSVQICPHLPRD
jgi:NAD(P)-dependent dehydrogenase (short-subunit alcohol dehydrogenase family)